MIGAVGLGVVVAVVVLLLFGRRRRRTARKFSADVLSDLLKLRKPYEGPRWRVGSRWL